MNAFFNVKDTLFNITSQYNEAIELLVTIGFGQIKDPEQRALFGKHISLEMALNMKQINVLSFEEQLVEAIALNQSIKEKGSNVSDRQDQPSIKIEGILPCPVKIPLLEGFESWLKGQEEAYTNDLTYNFKAASSGVDWLIDAIESSESAEVISDVFISAGFDLFFDRLLIGKYKAQGVFEDLSSFRKYNKDFDNQLITLKDPANQYSMLAVVPAIFLVNSEELKGRPMPKSWADLLKPEYENSVSLPIGDFDLFNAILLNIHRNHGEDGVRRLGKSLLRSMHPSEMVKSHTKKVNRPAITIMPYFFTKMTKQGGPMVAIWPEDGAIISPIFMLTKSAKKERLQPIVDFMTSLEVGNILSHQGLFPSVHPEIDNGIPESNTYMWLGWDYINSVDMGPLIQSLALLFDENRA